MSERIKKIVEVMTLEEKIGQLNLVSFSDKIIAEVKRGNVGAVINANDQEDVKGLQNAALSSRLGIPLLVGADVIHGLKTIFPVPLASASSFNLDLIQKSTIAATKEAIKKGINWIYAPILDISNDPRWGRINESAGEEPYYTSLVGEAIVKGIQHDGRVGACCKHYIGYGQVEAGIDYLPTDFSEQKLHNYFLPPYKKAVEAGALSMMSAFTTYNDLPITASSFLLKDILRNELAFEGVVVTDWDCLEHLYNYQLVSKGEEAAEIGITNGIDVDMHSRIYQRYLKQAIKQKPSLIKQLNESVFRVLKMKEKLGLFNNDYKTEIKVQDRSPLKIAHDLASESIILFKNEDNCLPLRADTKILVISAFNNDGDIHLGSWAGLGHVKDTITIAGGIKKYFPNSEFLNIPLEAGEDSFSIIKEKTKGFEIVLLSLGEPRFLSGENNNRAHLNLPGNQDLLVSYLVRENIPFITFVAAGRPLIINDIVRNSKALLWSFHLGHMAGLVLGETLVGINNPSAKTTLCFPRTVGQIPIYYNRLPCGRPDLINYLDEELTPLYSFGDGLSYSKFLYKDLKVKYIKDQQKVLVRGIIKNDSNLTGKEIIQVYILPKRFKTLYPRQSLIGFLKILVCAHEEKAFVIECDINKKLIIEGGQLLIGPSSKVGKYLNIEI